MLRETEWPVNSIAQAVGLSTSRLRRLFWEQEKTAPSMYRASKAKIGAAAKPKLKA
jgi:transcriptional regulator GlxA family with amidase domain